MKHIEKITATVEDFISECLRLDYEYEDIFTYLNTIHKG